MQVADKTVVSIDYTLTLTYEGWSQVENGTLPLGQPTPFLIDDAETDWGWTKGVSPTSVRRARRVRRRDESKVSRARPVQRRRAKSAAGSRRGRAAARSTHCRWRDVVTLDGNHPLAGVPLTFDVTVVGVRAATKQELKHGHAHGSHGHDH